MNNTMEKLINLKKGDIVTIFGISDFMASTTHGEFKATGMVSNGQAVFTENKKGARKKFTLRNLEAPDRLVFIGSAPFKTDGETELPGSGPFSSRMMRGNACFNLTGDPEVIKDWIQNKNINEKFTQFDSVIWINSEGKEIPLFPEVETNHAVVKSIRAQNAQ